MANLKCKIVQNTIDNIIYNFTPLFKIANSHMVDYFTKNLYETCVPDYLKNEISSNEYDSFFDIIFNNATNINAPQLHEYINKTKQFHLRNIKDVCLTESELNDRLVEWNCKDISSLKLQIFITSKKAHEVEILSKLAASLSYLKKTTHLIDIGDGKGYLSSMIAFYHKIPVLGIDSSLTNTNGAVKRVEKLSKVWNVIPNSKKSVLGRNDKINRCIEEEQLYKQLTQFVNEETDFKQLLSDIFLTNSLRYGLIGLHTCGNLGSTSVKTFNDSDCIKTLCNVSCCYHLLTDDCFPLSDYLKKSNFTISRTARMLSSHSIDRILHEKKMPSKTIFFRSILEVLFEKNNIPLENRQVGKQRKEFDSFNTYARSVLNKKNLCIQDDDLNELFSTYKDYEKQLNVYYFLRSLLAPIIESLILLDRLLYLYENQHQNAFLVQLFDPVISPRCYALVAFKDE